MRRRILGVLLALAFPIFTGPVGANPSLPETAQPAQEPQEPADLQEAEPAPLQLAGKVRLREVLRYGRQRNPGLRAARSDLRQAYWAYRQSSSLSNGQLQVGSLNGQGTAANNSNFSGLNYDIFAAFNQSFGPLGARRAASQAALRGYWQAEAQLQMNQVQLDQNVKDAFYGLLAAQQKLRMARANLELADDILVVADKRFEVGAGPKLELLNARVQRNRFRQQSVQAQNGLEQAQIQLANLLAAPEPVQLVVEGSLKSPGPHFELPQLLSRSQRSARLLSQQQAVEKARWDTEAARAQANPTPSLSLAYSFANPSYAVGTQLTFPIDWGENDSAVHQAEAVQSGKEANLQSEKLAVTSAVQSSLSNYLAARQNAHDYQTDILMPQEEATRITNFGYLRGALPYTQILIAQQQLRDVRAELIDRLLTMQIAFDALEAAVGEPLWEALERSPETAECDAEFPIDTPPRREIRARTKR